MSNKRIILNKDELYQKYIIEGLSQKDTAVYFDCSIDTIVRNLKEYNIPSHISNYHAHEQKVFLDNVQINYLYGAMLGDGCLTKTSHNVNSQFVYTSKSYQHVEYVSQPFISLSYKEGINYVTYFDKRTNKTYERYTFRTITDVGFEKERKLWYPDGIKHIPNNLKLNSEICLIWYIGDGGICNGKNSQYIKLSTQCFKKEEQEDILLPQLSDFNATLMKSDTSYNGEQQYFIYIPHNKMSNFLDYIGNCPFDDYLYKWNFKKYQNKVSLPQTDNEKYFIRLYLLGLKCRQIAEVFDVDFNTVKRYLIKNNIYKGE